MEIILNPKASKSKAARRISAIVVLIALALGYPLASPHCWLSASGVRVVYAGKTSLGSRAYRSNSGQFIIKLNEPGEFIYWIKTEDHKVISANPNNFSFFSPAVLVAHISQGGVDLEDWSKNEYDPRIVAGRNFIEFNSRNKDRNRVKVEW